MCTNSYFSSQFFNQFFKVNLTKSPVPKHGFRISSISIVCNLHEKYQLNKLSDWLKAAHVNVLPCGGRVVVIWWGWPCKRWNTGIRWVHWWCSSTLWPYVWWRFSLLQVNLNVKNVNKKSSVLNLSSPCAPLLRRTILWQGSPYKKDRHCEKHILDCKSICCKKWSEHLFVMITGCPEKMEKIK